MHVGGASAREKKHRAVRRVNNQRGVAHSLSLLLSPSLPYSRYLLTHTHAQALPVPFPNAADWPRAKRVRLAPPTRRPLLTRAHSFFTRSPQSGGGHATGADSFAALVSLRRFEWQQQQQQRQRSCRVVQRCGSARRVRQRIACAAASCAGATAHALARSRHFASAMVGHVQLEQHWRRRRRQQQQCPLVVVRRTRGRLAARR